MRHHYLKSLFLAAALSAPILTLPANATPAAPSDPQEHRYYDRDHRDYHTWNPDEDRYYHRYWEERHRDHEFREFRRLKAREQREYWRWRHEHEERH